MALLLALSGCHVNTAPSGPKQHSNVNLELDKSEMVRAVLDIKAGEIKVRGGAAKLLEAGFDYDHPEWKPVVDYKNSSFRGELRVEQGTNISLGSSENIWDLKFNDGVPLDLETKLGAGKADLKLGSLSLRSVSVKAGAGEVIVDLRGQPKRSYTVEVHGGVGEATVYLPKDVGVSASASGGIGSINTEGLTKRDGRWINPDQEHSSILVRVDVHGGVGEINLIR